VFPYGAKRALNSSRLFGRSLSLPSFSAPPPLTSADGEREKEGKEFDPKTRFSSGASGGGFGRADVGIGIYRGGGEDIGGGVALWCWAISISISVSVDVRARGTVRVGTGVGACNHRC
jgi:hypothetical protein